VRNLVRAGVPERVAMQLTGHKTRAVFERYNIMSPGDLRDAAKRLDALGRLAEAERQFETALSLDADLADARDDLAAVRAFGRRGR
jgi:hypothetical protein